MRANARTRGTKKARQPVSAPVGARAYLMRANVALAPSGLKSSSLCLSMCCSALDCRWIINRRCAPRGAREAQPLRRAAPSACGAHGMPARGGGGRARSHRPVPTPCPPTRESRGGRPSPPRTSPEPPPTNARAPRPRRRQHRPLPSSGRPYAPLRAPPRPTPPPQPGISPLRALWRCARPPTRAPPRARARVRRLGLAGVCDNQRMCTF